MLEKNFCEYIFCVPQKNTMLEVDKILEKCGDFGLMQVLMLLLFSLINVLSAMHYYSQTIISFVPKYWYV